MRKSGVMLMTLDFQVADQSPGVALSKYIKCWNQSMSKLELLLPLEHEAHTYITVLVDKCKTYKKKGGKEMIDKQLLQFQVKEESALLACD
eukprot:11155947-Ditylum_brightwellii.AAC.1